jgi:hypothetical protein
MMSDFSVAFRSVVLIHPKRVALFLFFSGIIFVASNLFRMPEVVFCMNRRILITLVVAVGLSFGLMTPVQAVETPSETVSLQCEGESLSVDVDSAVSLYNQNTDAVPSAVDTVVNSNTTHLQIRGAQQEYYTAHTDGLNITSVELGQIGEPDVIMITDRETACDLYVSDQPVSDFQDAYANDDIELEAKGTVNSATVYAIEAVSDGIDFINKSVGELLG